MKGEGRPLVEVRGERTTCRDAEGLRGQQSAGEGEMLARKCPGRVSEWVSVALMCRWAGFSSRSRPLLSV